MRGRPRIAPERNKRRVYSVRTTEARWEKIKAAANAEGLTLAVYVERLIDWAVDAHNATIHSPPPQGD